MYKYLLLAYYLLVAGNLAAQMPQISARVNTNDVLIGDHIQYTITVNYDAEIFAIGMPTITDSNIAPFTVIAEDKADTSGTLRNREIRKTYIISCYDSGKHFIQTPQLNVLYEAEALSIPSNEPQIAVNVRTVPVDLNGDIKDIKEASLSKAGSLLNILKIIVAVLVVLLALLAAYYLIRRVAQRKKQNIFNATITKLEALKKVDTPNAKQLYIELTEAVKQYITYRLQIPVSFATTQQVIQIVPQNKFLYNSKDIIVDILKSADKVKFANADASPQQIKQHLQQSLDLVRHLEQLAVQEEQQQAKKNNKK